MGSSNDRGKKERGDLPILVKYSKFIENIMRNFVDKKKWFSYARIRKVTKLAYSNNFLTWSIFTFLVFSVFSTMSIYAQEDPGVRFDATQAHEDVPFYKNVMGYDEEVSIQKDNLTTGANSVTSLLQTATVAFLPPAFENYEEAVENAEASGRRPTLLAQKGVLGSITEANVVMVGVPPSVDLIAFMAEEWVPGYDQKMSGVYAQESGYSYLTAVNIADIWQTTRMIAYSLFVIALIIAGFMIMFRQKIGGQVSVTVFNTIPKVIMGLILVTFSFAIVGLVMDFGALLIRVISEFLVPNGEALVVSNPFSLLQGLLSGNESFGAIKQVFGVSALTSIVTGGLGLLALATPAAPIGGALLGMSIVSMILALVILGIVTWASIKVFVALLKAWVGIIVDTIMGPLFLAIAVIPGRSNVGSDWFRRIVKNVLTFVGVFFLLNLGGLLAAQNVQFFFPAGLAGGEMDTTTNSAVLTFMMNSFIPLFLFFTASEVPKFLDDFLPTNGGKGASAAFGGVQKSFAKIPIVGGAFG